MAFSHTTAPPHHVPAARMTFRELISEDLDTALRRDPAARNRLEVALSYPGVHALWAHRLSHRIWTRGGNGAQILARMIRPFIDHATGVVIGETASVGEDCLIFHGVTLGGQQMIKGKRHPTVGDRVMIGAGAKVLGPINIGSDAKIGANAVVVRDVPDSGIALGVPAKVRKPKRPIPDCMNIDPSVFI